MKDIMKKGVLAGSLIVMALASGCGGGKYPMRVTQGGAPGQDRPENGPLGSNSGQYGAIYKKPVIVPTLGDRSFGASVDAQTKDVDLQRASLQQADLDNRALSLANQYQMNVESARQLTQLADQMQQLSSQGSGLSDEDRSALAGSALEVAGIQGEDVNTAIATMIKTGDQSAVNELISRAATHLGMSSPDALRRQILPSLGIQLGQ